MTRDFKQTVVERVQREPAFARTLLGPEFPADSVIEAAKQAGKTPHDFILAALTKRAERDVDFDAFAEQRSACVAESGKTISWQEMRRYLEDRAAGRPARRPKPRKPAKPQ